MFKVGDYIVYGCNGVCRVESIGPVDNIEGISSERMYYTLIPVYLKGSKLITPVDNNKVIMRSIISKEEALLLINEIKDIDLLVIEDEKSRDSLFKETLKKCDCRELVRIIKTLYVRKLERISHGKKGKFSDDKYLDLAEESLYGELALPLEMDKKQVEKFIIENIEKMQD